jgi:hypothetical protein
VVLVLMLTLVLVLVMVLVPVMVLVTVAAVAPATDQAFFRCDHLVYTLVNLPLQTTVLVKKPWAA